MFTCDICQYASHVKRNLDRHLKTQNHFNKHYELLKIKNIEMTVQNQSLEKQIQEKNKLIDNMSMHIGELMDMKTEVTSLSRTTTNLFKVIEANSKAKVFAQIENIDNLGIDYDNNSDFAIDLVIKYKNNLFIKCVGDFIVNNYKKDDPLEQSVFNCDIARNNYKYIEDGLKWYNDRSGNQTKHIAIKPVLEYIKIKLMDHFTNEKREEIIKNNVNVAYQLELYALSIKLNDEINSGTIESKILRYVSSQLPLSGNQQKLIENHTTQKKRKYVRKQKDV